VAALELDEHAEQQSQLDHDDAGDDPGYRDDLGLFDHHQQQRGNALMDKRDETLRDKVDTIKGDVRDGLDEAKERVGAQGEKAKRAVEGDAMPLGDRVASHANEFGHEVKADYDKSKRELRDEGI
jgi:type IV secretory pathway VirB10-like protein